jgi:hypothetical protein
MKSMLGFSFLVFCFHISIGQSQLSEDSYTRYELLEPTTQSFRIIYQVSATTPGMPFYYNSLRKGSGHTIGKVIDMMTGKNLEWTIVSGSDARKAGWLEAEPDGEYLKVKLERLLPAGGEYRLLIDKTYKDEVSYYTKDEKIVFNRSLGIKRNAIILPKGYELIKCNYPSQIMMEQDGRIKVSFINSGAQDVAFHLEAKKLTAVADLTVSKFPSTETTAVGQGRDKSKARINFNFSERSGETREIVYFLQQPETHSFRLYHDYTETKEGTDRYINVVRTGSKASYPSAKLLDTGNDLKVETLKGEAIQTRGLDIGEPVNSETEVVVIWYDPVKKGQTLRLRIEETYTDANRYILNRNEFIFDRAFGRPFNTVVLPEGWFLTSNAMPATVDTQDGKVSLTYVNDSPGEIEVYIKGRKK